MISLLKKLAITVITPALLQACGSDDDNVYRVVLGTNNILETTASSLQYQLPFSVQVTTVDGTPASFVTLTFTAQPSDYRKGYYQTIDTTSPPDGTPDQWVPVHTATCNIEDSNLNGIMESGEDINGNGILDPTNPATISAHDTLTPTIDNVFGHLTTDENGFGYFVMTYPPSEAYWVSIKLIAMATGNSQPEIYETLLPALASDLDDPYISPPGGVNGKYGIASVCTDPN